MLCSLIVITLSLTQGKDKGGKEKGGGEEKRKHIKSMIDKIPTSKEELFAYPIDSSLVDNVSDFRFSVSGIYRDIDYFGIRFLMFLSNCKNGKCMS